VQVEYVNKPPEGSAAHVLGLLGMYKVFPIPLHCSREEPANYQGAICSVVWPARLTRVVGFFDPSRYEIQALAHASHSQVGVSSLTMATEITMSAGSANRRSCDEFPVRLRTAGLDCLERPVVYLGFK